MFFRIRLNFQNTAELLNPDSLTQNGAKTRPWPGWEGTNSSIFDTHYVGSRAKLSYLRSWNTGLTTTYTFVLVFSPYGT